MMTIARLAPLILAFAASSAAAHGDVKCPVHPKSEWRPHTELQQELTAEGPVIRRTEASATCYEVYAKDPNGKRIEAFFDPVRFKRVNQ